MKRIPRKLPGRVSLIGVLGILCSAFVGRATAQVVVWGKGGTNITALTNVIAVDGGADHSLALRSDGTVAAWGANGSGQINVPPGLTNAVAVAAGDYYSMALRTDGRVVVWGDNTYGQANPPAEATNLVAVAAGGEHCLALKADGTVIAWGRNVYGQTRVPPGLSNVAAIAAGAVHSLALRSDGTLVAWGWDSNGQITVPLNATNVSAISAGSFHNLALRRDGRLVAWGYGGFGQTGIPTEAINVVGIAAGGYHNVALRLDRTVIAWGWEVAGQVPAPAGLSNVVAVGAGAYHSLAAWREGVPPVVMGQPVSQVGFLGGSVTFDVTAIGTAPLHYQWQFNDTALDGATNRVLILDPLRLEQSGQYSVLVQNAFGTTTSSNATLVVSRVAVWGRKTEGQANVPAGLTNVTGLAAGGNHSLALITDGKVVAWGADNFGQSTVPGNLSNVMQIASHHDHNLALTTAGTVIAWGRNDSGQTNVPTTLTNALAVGAGQFHSLALRSNGTVVAWGGNQVGQTNVPSNLTNVVAIASGYNHSLALTTEGRVIGWGNNGYGQANVPLPLENVVVLAAGVDHSLALRADGTVVAWGSNGSGQTNVPPNLSNVVAIAAGARHSLALRNDEIVVAWGEGNFGQLAIPAKLTNLTAIAAGEAHSVALVGDGAPVSLGMLSKRTAFTGTTLILNAGAVGAPPPSYQWQFNGTDLAGATNAFLVLTNAYLAQFGNYSVVVSNPLGSVTNSATVTVIESAPTIVLQPANQATYPGAAVTFRAIADGSEPLRYQWYHDGVNIAGATNSSLSLGRVRFADAGQYRVVVRNAFGTASSSKAMLSIPRVVAIGRYTLGRPHCNSNIPTFVPDDLTNQIVAAAGGYHHSIALRADGRVEAWGDVRQSGWCLVDYGQLNVPPDLTNAVAIAAGAYHNLAVRSDGTVTAWGSNKYGESSVPPGLTDVVAVAATEYNSLALRADGTAIGWGDYFNLPPSVTNVVAIAGNTEHSEALLADGTVFDWASAFGINSAPSGLSNVVAISPGEFYYALALKADGTVALWSWDRPGSATITLPGVSNVVDVVAGFGQNTALKSDGTLTGLSCCPVRPAGPPGLTSVVGLGSGPYHLLALVDEGTIVRPGDFHMARLRWISGGAAPWFAQTSVTYDGGDALQSGAITQGQQSRIRTAVFGPGTLSFWWKISSQNKGDSLRFYLGGVELARLSGETGWQQHAILLPAGIQLAEWVYTKGKRSRAQGAGWLDRVRFTPRGTVQPVITIQPADQSAWRGTTATFSLRVVGVEPLHFQWQFHGTNLFWATNSVLTLTNVQFADAGYYSVRVSNAYGATTSSNALLTVTDGRPQIVGQPTNQVTNPGRGVAFQVVTIGTAPQSFQWRFENEDIAGATNETLILEKASYRQAGAYSVRVRNEHGAVVSSSASLFVVSVLAWGDDTQGQSNFVIGLTNAVGVAAGYSHSIALRSDGTVVAWGDNSAGQATVPASLSNVVAIAAGYSHNLALRSDGTVAAWGDNTYGQLNVPPGLSNVVAISASAQACLALLRDGTVRAWGRNYFGQTTLPAGLTNVIAVAMGEKQAVALRSDGTVVAWGYNGLGATDPPPGLSNVLAIASGASHNLALRGNGTVVGWGYWYYGQLNPPDSLTNAVAIAAADDHSLALRTDGTVVGWGRNDFGQLKVPAGLSNVLAIAAGPAHTMALVGENLLPARLGVAPKLLDPVRGGNQFNARLSSFVGKVYAFEFKDSLAESNWLARPLVLGDGTVKLLTDPAATSPQRFYRVRQF